MPVLTDDQAKRARMVLELGHVIGVKRVEVGEWLAARNAGELELQPRALQRLTDLHAAFAATGNDTGGEPECDRIRAFEAAARRADAFRAAAIAASLEYAEPTCPRCAQTMITAGRCASCDQADTDQGGQLGMFEIAATLPAKTAKALRAPQPEGLF